MNQSCTTAQSHYNREATGGRHESSTEWIAVVTTSISFIITGKLMFEDETIYIKCRPFKKVDSRRLSGELFEDVWQPTIFVCAELH